MYQQLDTITLRTGEQVEAAAVRGPDLDWAPRLEEMLRHKGDIWQWQNARVLARDLGIDVNFYVLHRDGEPFANVLICSVEGVGLLGHVWTHPGERRKGASSALMRAALDDFRSRDGRALLLGTGSPVAMRMYEQLGFRNIEPESYAMGYYVTSQAEFEEAFFAPAATEVQPVAWRHWAPSSFLFAGDFPGVVRSAPLKLIGRGLTEGPLLPLLREADEGATPPRGMVLQNRATKAVVGLAAWGWHPIWPETCLLDVYCHPNYWEQAGALLAALELPAARRYVAYGDAACPAKHHLLRAAGFEQTNTLSQWVSADAARSSFVDVLQFERK